MTNETTIKVPKKYQHMLKSICYGKSWRGKYVLTFLPGFCNGCELYYTDSQADALEMIRLTYAAIQEATPVLALESVESEAESFEDTDFGKHCALVDLIARNYGEGVTPETIIADCGGTFRGINLSTFYESKWIGILRFASKKRERLVAKGELANVEETTSGQDALSRTDTTTSLESKSHVDDLEVLENDGSAVSHKQGSVPFTVAADASAASSDQTPAAPVVDDQRVEYVVTESLHSNGYPVVNVYCLSRVYSHHRFSNNSRFPTRRAALVYARLRLEALPDSAAFCDYTGLGALPL